MSYQGKYRRPITSTALFPYVSYASAEFHFEPASKLTCRTVKITDRREIEVKERKASAASSLFGPPAPETTKTWSSEKTIEIEETYE